MKKELIFQAMIVGLILGLFLFLGILLDSYCYEKELNPRPGDRETKIVTKIIDGDTIIVEGGERIRFLGIDCDERGERCYNQAKEYLEKRIYEKEVILESDIQDKDRYGRSLRYVFFDGENINVKLVEEGYCTARFERETRYKNQITIAERNAIENKIGCKWGE